ncbi:MAG: methyltransferase domain-containing protein, partial [Candidatus Kapaibacteriota bacterium]
VEPLHPAYAAQMTVHLLEFVASTKQTAQKNNDDKVRIIDAGPCTGTILIPTAEMFPDIEFIAVEPDQPSCQILREAIKQRGIKNIRVIEKGLQEVSLEQDLEGKGVHGLYSSFAMHHMPMEDVLRKINQIACPEAQILITDEWIGKVGSKENVQESLMSYHVPIIIERCKLAYYVDLDKLLEANPKRVTQRQIELVRDFSRDAHILFDLVCNKKYQDALDLIDQMTIYNERYADIFEEKHLGNDTETLHPTIAILLFGIQEFSALHQGVQHYTIEHKSNVDDFTQKAIRDYGMEKVRESPTLVLGTENRSQGIDGGIMATQLKKNTLANTH